MPACRHQRQPVVKGSEGPSVCRSVCCRIKTLTCAWDSSRMPANTWWQQCVSCHFLCSLSRVFLLPLSPVIFCCLRATVFCPASVLKFDADSGILWDRYTRIVFGPTQSQKVRLWDGLPFRPTKPSPRVGSGCHRGYSNLVTPWDIPLWRVRWLSVESQSAGSASSRTS